MNTDMRVAVCTNRHPEAVREALTALRDAAPALVTSGLQPAQVEAHRAAFGGTLLVEPRPGLSRARNRALTWAAEQGAEVLAFVDDDAVVEPGWWDALNRRWAEAGDDVACIGGPIRPRFLTPPPPWFSDGIAHTLTLLDHPGEVVYGANISFRVTPLLQAGGFDPRFGHAGRRAFFGEEVVAQQTLARLGFRTCFAPEAGVHHVIPPERLTRASFLRRRFAYGQTVGMQRERPWTLAAGQALKSLGGTAIAAANGDSAGAMERAVRAAENLGVLYGSTRPRLIA